MYKIITSYYHNNFFPVHISFSCSLGPSLRLYSEWYSYVCNVCVCMYRVLCVSELCWVNMLCALVFEWGSWRTNGDVHLLLFVWRSYFSLRGILSPQAHMVLLNTLHTHTHAHAFQPTLHCLSFLKSYPCLETVLPGKTRLLEYPWNPTPPYSTGH